MISDGKSVKDLHIEELTRDLTESRMYILKLEKKIELLTSVAEMAEIGLKLGYWGNGSTKDWINEALKAWRGND